MAKPKLEELVDKFGKAYKLIKNYSNNAGWEKQYVNELFERLEEIKKDIKQPEDKQLETIRVFYERRIKIPQRHKGTIRTLCNLNPDFHKAMQDICNSNIFREKNNKHLQEVLGKSLLGKNTKAAA